MRRLLRVVPCVLVRFRLVVVVPCRCPGCRCIGSCVPYLLVLMGPTISRVSHGICPSSAICLGLPAHVPVVFLPAPRKILPGKLPLMRRCGRFGSENVLYAAYPPPPPPTRCIEQCWVDGAKSRGSPTVPLPGLLRDAHREVRPLQAQVRTVGKGRVETYFGGWSV